MRDYPISDAIFYWMAANPWRVCALLCAVILIVSAVEGRSVMVLAGIGG